METIIGNGNSESLLQWLFRKSDPLENICFFYISVFNANNARYAPLFEHSQCIRMVYLKGLPIKFTDKIMLFLFRKIPIVFSRKITRYKVLHIFGLLNWPITSHQVLHLDDPLYTIDEVKDVIKWERALIAKNSTPILICTNQYTSNWFKAHLANTKVLIIEQGFSELKVKAEDKKSKVFTCVYSSPYIHYSGDKHGSHSTWGAKILIDEIIPQLYRLDSSIRVVLIGELGQNASRALSNYSNWISFGRVDPFQNQVLISSCDIGLYPRMYDHKRSILKVMSYLGAGLPIVTFDLIDTKIVKDHDLGPVVSTVNEFVLSVIKLKKSPKLMNFYREKVNSMNSQYTWEKLAQKMEKKIAFFVK